MNDPYILGVILFACTTYDFVRLPTDALPVSAFWFALLIAFMNHLGGCFADLYAFFVMLRQGKDLLLLDDGKEQHVFVPAE